MHQRNTSGMKGEESGLFLAHLLATCAKYIEDGDFINAGIGLKNIATVASPDGDPMRRLASHFSKALSYKMVNNNTPNLAQVLHLTNPWSTLEQQYARKLFFEFLPFLKFSYVITNHVIAEAMEREKGFHVIDLNACDAAHWIHLLHTLKEKRQQNPLSYLKITGVHKDKEVLDQVRFQLNQEADRMNIQFTFYPIESTLEKLCFENLPVKPGEPLAVSCVLHLHSLQAIDAQVRPPNSVLPTNPFPFKMRWFLSSIWKLQPRLMVITERESDTNGPNLTERFQEGVKHYAALFDCLETNVPEAKAGERIMLERILLGEEIKNLIACDGDQRTERHGKFLKTWNPLLKMAGFMRVPMSYERMLQATRPLQSYGRGYKLLENNQCLFICWNDLPLYSISAWRFYPENFMVSICRSIKNSKMKLIYGFVQFHKSNWSKKIENL